MLAVGVCLAVAGCATRTDLSQVRSFVYQLQRFQFDQLLSSDFDLYILADAAAGNSPDRIQQLQDAGGRRHFVLAYLSIGEAEDYMPYWKHEWRRNPPEWLGERNPRWKGNYKVQYWDPDWQRVILGSEESLLDGILRLGFDGVYLDVVDAYEHYEDLGRDTAAQEMVDFVKEIARYARRRSPGFLVFPQNAEELGPRFPNYLEMVDGVGVEDLYYGDPLPDEATPPGITREREDTLAKWVSAGKLVLTTDYSNDPEQIADAYTRSRAQGFVPYVTNLALGTLRINEGWDPPARD